MHDKCFAVRTTLALKENCRKSACETEQFASRRESRRCCSNSYSFTSTGPELFLNRFRRLSLSLVFEGGALNVLPDLCFASTDLR